MQMLWLDVDPSHEIEHIVRCCVCSKYSIQELEQIYWNEVMPALSFNLRFGNVIPEWTGFKEAFLKERIFQTHRFGKRLPIKLLHPYARHLWGGIQTNVQALRLK